jgi:SAM-dependent methyltransferase
LNKRSALFAVVLTCLLALPIGAQSGSESRDKIEQPVKVMEVTGVKPGMVIGEVGAGHGYFTFWLAKGVGEGGKVYANDIDSSALASLDMVFIINAFHDLAQPVELLANLRPALKPGATVVIMDRDPARFSDSHGHFFTREKVEGIVGRSVFELVRVETFLRDHNLYILRAKPAA